MFWQIMFFYALLSCFIMPYIGYYFMGISGLGNGYVIGTIVSLIFYSGLKNSALFRSPHLRNLVTLPWTCICYIFITCTIYEIN